MRERWMPMRDLGDLGRDVERFLGHLGPRLMGEIGQGQPSVDIEDREDSYLVVADIPGMPRDNLDISVTPSTLSLSGRAEHSREVESPGRYLTRERGIGQFNRTFSLPEEVDPGRARATFRDGLLEIELPKAERARGRRLEIEDGPRH